MHIKENGNKKDTFTYNPKLTAAIFRTRNEVREFGESDTYNTY